MAETQGGDFTGTIFKTVYSELSFGGDLVTILCVFRKEDGQLGGF